MNISDSSQVWKILAPLPTLYDVAERACALRYQDPSWLNVRPPLDPMSSDQLDQMVGELRQIDLPEAYSWMANLARWYGRFTVFEEKTMRWELALAQHPMYLLNSRGYHLRGENPSLGCADHRSIYRSCSREPCRVGTLSSLEVRL